MKILSIQRFNTVVGGRERYSSELRNLLEKYGNEVTEFTLKEPVRDSVFPNQYQSPALNVSSDLLLERITAAMYRLHNPQSATVIQHALEERLCEVAHVHTLHHISPYTLSVLREHHVPVVWTLHDYQIICPNSILFTEGNVCNRCYHHHYFNAVIHRCNSGSYSHSIISAIDNTWAWISKALSSVYRFIAPSEFTRRKVIEFGIPENRVVCLPHFSPTYKWRYTPPINNGTILFAGRLIEQKGVSVFIDALSKLRLPRSQQIMIVGDGPELDNLHKQVASQSLENVSFAEFASDNQMQMYLEQCRFTVMPSIWYEVMGFALLESFTVGRPVVASQIGGIPEVVTHNLNGRLVPPNNAEELAAQIDWMLSNPRQVIEMGHAAHDTVLEKYTPEIHYNELMRIYSQAIVDQSS